MARYTHDSVERVRDAVDMVDLVGARTELKRSGTSRLQGLCPFHDERTPSFGIDPVQKLYHCFGCGAGGDAISFVRETEGVDFKGAIELLADRYGVQLEVEDEDPEQAQRRQARQRLYDLLERTAAYYVRVLWESREAAGAREYLLGRGLEESFLRQFRVGYAPSGWAKVMDASRRAGFSNRELYDAGLVTRAKGEGRLYDRFRGRVMFPLADARGRVVGFGARAMGESLGAKYVNTPESELFHKRKQVYGADVARAAAAKAGSVIVTEGYTDVIALHQAGFANSVCIMGTSLTEEQVRVLRRLAPVAHLALDADNAGQEAMLRAARVAAGEQLELRVVPLPEGLDPADLVRRDGRDEVDRLLARSMPFVRFRVQRELAKGDLSSPEGRQRVAEEVAPVMAEVPPGIVRDELVRTLSDRLDIRAEVLEGQLRLLAARPRPAAPSPPSRSAPAAPPAPARPQASASPPPDLAGILDRAAEPERRFLAFCIALPDAGREALGRIDVDEHLTSPVVRRAAEHLRHHLDSPTTGLPEDDEALTALVRQLTVRASQEPASPAALRAQRLHLELRRLERLESTLRAAGQGGVAEVAARKQLVKAEMGEAVEEAAAN
jgi:DNA primase